MTVTVAQLELAVTNQVDGGTINDNFVGIVGTLQAPPNSGVTVNGVVAQIVGTTFYATDVPLAQGTNLLAVTVTSFHGQSATQSLSLASTGPAPIQILATPTYGPAPLRVDFTAANNGPNAIQRIEGDIDGNGTIDITTTGDFYALYPTPGVRQATVTVTDTAGNAFSRTFPIVVRNPDDVDQSLRGIWRGFSAALVSGDMAGALEHFMTQSRPRYAAIFGALAPQLPVIAEAFSTLQKVSTDEDIADYAINRTVNGSNLIFLVTFIRDKDGVWRLEGM